MVKLPIDKRSGPNNLVLKVWLRPNQVYLRLLELGDGAVAISRVSDHAGSKALPKRPLHE